MEFLCRAKAAQRFGSPAAVMGKSANPKNYFAGKVPLHTHAEGGQVQPMLGSHWD
jgi:hypothetical protein